MYIWLECPLCHGPYVMMTRRVHGGDALLAKDFLRPDLTPYPDYEVVAIPPCMTCGEMAFTPESELIRTSDTPPYPTNS